jgi:hypothetical protein
LGRHLTISIGQDRRRAGVSSRVREAGAVIARAGERGVQVAWTNLPRIMRNAGQLYTGPARGRCTETDDGRCCIERSRRNGVRAERQHGVRLPVLTM